MNTQSSASRMALIAGFVVIIFGVPAGQVAVELMRGERAQFTDLFRYAPTEKNLRLYERSLENCSWFKRTLGKRAQYFLFSPLRDLGAKGTMGRSDWVFYRPGVRYLIEPDRPEPAGKDSSPLPSRDLETARSNVVRAIVRFRDQLQERGIRLLVVPTPGKASVYPDKLTRRMAGKIASFRSPTLDLIEALRAENVDTADLFAVFKNQRTDKSLMPSGTEYYLARDTHWTPEGASLAARAVAERVRQMGLEPQTKRKFVVTSVHVARYGDVLEMMQVPGVREYYPAQVVECRRVVDKTFGPLIPEASGSPGMYTHPLGKSSILVLGDSFCRIYQTREPKSLGRVIDDAGAESGKGRGDVVKDTKQLLPGSAGFLSHLALELGWPVDYIVSDGGASSDVRKKLSLNAEILEDKTLVIWEFVERDIPLGSKGWEDVPLPPKLPGT